MFKRLKGKVYAVAPAAGAMALLSGGAMASSGTDFSGILSGIDGGTAVTAIVAAAAILALVGFAAWGAKKVGRFFG